MEAGKPKSITASEAHTVRPVGGTLHPSHLLFFSVRVCSPVARSSFSVGLPFRQGGSMHARSLSSCPCAITALCAHDFSSGVRPSLSSSLARSLAGLVSMSTAAGPGRRRWWWRQQHRGTAAAAPRHRSGSTATAAAPSALGHPSIVFFPRVVNRAALVPARGRKHRGDALRWPLSSRYPRFGT